ncbi:putative membrane protein [Asticcacaulis biprosthecium C19]|uniref:Putative membrane protein n=1 Tax=Asticcacaulis biprosthecium C19 TaxID=715226 RepID=F4QGN4_9CAUL|nr:hypothetical protein [Asticcacaulis biprosthecium]EGF92486.1 putative membrane protein [Asticcacaulis biprosthecium C19]
MTATRGTFITGIVFLGAMAGLLGGFNLHWSREPVFPLYGILIDVLAVPALIYVLLYVRRLKVAATDEFAQTKKRLAAQTGIVIGFGLFAVSGIVPMIFPDAYTSFIGTLDGAHEGFLMGRVLGMAPFVLGLIVGQVVVWTKYR